MNEIRSSKAKYIWITLLLCVVATPICLLILFGMGQHSGQEFSPDDFSRRSFRYNQVPGLGWVISKKTYNDSTKLLEQNLTADKLIKPVINQKKNWHLIRDSGDFKDLVSHECDARFLCEYLDMTDDEGENFWIQWNEKFPETAKVFWPVVAELARDQMYLKIPDVMQLAMQNDADQPDKFQTELNQLTAEIYLELGSLDLELEKLPRARARLDKSIQFLPSKKANQKRQECLAKLGEQAESNLDLESDRSVPDSPATGSLAEENE